MVGDGGGLPNSDYSDLQFCFSFSITSALPLYLIHTLSCTLGVHVHEKSHEWYLRRDTLHSLGCPLGPGVPGAPAGEGTQGKVGTWMWPGVPLEVKL